MLTFASRTTTAARGWRVSVSRPAAPMPPVRSILHGPRIQPKLKVGAANDPAEAEADRVADQVMRMPESRPAADVPQAVSRGNVVRRICAECEEEAKRKPADESVRRMEEEDDELLRSKEEPGKVPVMSAPAERAISGLNDGAPLPVSERAFFEPRFGRDFSNVRIHDGPTADAAAGLIKARAFALGNDIAFARGEYSPGSSESRRLLAHELTHTVQQGGSDAEELQRSCSSAAACAAPIVGNPEEFTASESAIEAGPRARRRKMTPARARISGHAGRAKQLENILSAHSAAQRAVIHGIFIDQDMSSGTAAMVVDCAAWHADSLPAGDTDPSGMTAAATPCMFVHGQLNQEALRFNHGDATIGGRSRDAWLAEALNTLIHESEHVRFGTVEPGLAVPAGVTSPSCTKGNVEFSLSEIVAILSEFPLHFDAAQAEASATGPAHARLTTYLNGAVSNPGESLEGALLNMGCDCDCPEVDLFVVQAVDAMTTAFTAAQKTSLRTELQTLMPSPTRPFWPAAPTP